MQREALCQRARQRHHHCTATSAGSAACPVLPKCQSRSLTHIASAKTRGASSGKSHASARVKVNYRVGGDDADAGPPTHKPGAAAPAPPAAVSAPSQPRPATAARLPTPSPLQSTTSARAPDKANMAAALSPLGGTVTIPSAAAAAPFKAPQTSSSKAAAPSAPPLPPLAAPSQPSAPTSDAPAPAAQAPSSPAPAPPPPQPRAQLKVIGLGMRGISAVHRLIDSGTLAEAEFWAIDSDKRVLSGTDEAVRLLEVAPGDDATLSAEELAEVAGGAASPAAPGAPDGTAGAVFVLGSAFGSPGGAPMLLQLVRHLRRQGYFVAAALTRPFEFEGSRRLEAADALITTLEEVAHLVVVISQGVLTRASAELTMSQAEAIADNTLVYTVQSTMWALRAPEILKVSNGAFLWYGRDLRAIRRPLFPPMMNLLSCPGHATLGRGQAALPLPLLQQAGLASALSTLAEDAVRAASESPFLDNRLEAATGVLCVLRVPPSILGVAPAAQGVAAAAVAATGAAGSGGGALVTDNHKEYALRSAVQVAAMTVRELVGPHCHDIIVCPQLSADVEEGSHQGEAGDEGAGRGADGKLVRVEVSLLALEAIEEAAGGMKVAGKAGPPPAVPRSPSPSPSAGPGSGALPRSPSPAAAMARERTAILVSTSTRATSAQRRGIWMGGGMGLQGARGGPGAGPGPSGAPSIFSSQQPAAAAPQHQPGSSKTPAVQGPAAAPRPGNPAAAPAGVAQATVGGAAADAAAIAAANSARKLSRLAAMSALAGGSAAAVHYTLGSTAQYGATARTGPAPAPAAAPAAPPPPQPAVQPQPQAGGRSSSARAPLGTPAPPPPLQQQQQASPVAASQPMPQAAPTIPQQQQQQQAGPVQAAQYGNLQQQAPPPVPQQQQQPVAMPSPYASVPQKGTWGRLQAPSTAPAAAAPGASPTALATGGAAAQAPAGVHSAPGADSSVQQIPRLSENMVTSLVAQSLDLPPQAAQWRHRHRAPPPGMRAPRPSVFQLPKVEEERVEADGAGQPAEGAGPGLGRGLHQLMAGMGLPLPPAGPPPVSSRTLVRSRTVGMLEQERIEEEIELEIQAGLLPGPGAVAAGVTGAGAGPDA